ncbi:hypothetical protein CHS0354_041380 [Potamilus streckersoni]|uniref:Uncharacterized protein n=1 Tax=Potamilus streckersoni TaxID=2493646 RepID=A0AAE0TAV2_9BIVA|nr:hypothetical protein CHS0354_041380 [Potamilus streckersoni]
MRPLTSTNWSWNLVQSDILFVISKASIHFAYYPILKFPYFDSRHRLKQEIILKPSRFLRCEKQVIRPGHLVIGDKYLNKMSLSKSIRLGRHKTYTETIQYNKVRLQIRNNDIAKQRSYKDGTWTSMSTNGRRNPNESPGLVMLLRQKHFFIFATASYR